MQSRSLDKAPAFAASVPPPITSFLRCPSSSLWAEQAAHDLPTLLVDHASCELKAASTALSLIHRYPLNRELVYRMSRLAREELRHFEQVNKLIEARSLKLAPVSAARYASELRGQVSSDEPMRLVDTLIIGAIIEARSCERFALIAPYLDSVLEKFYLGLLASEARHFEHYLELARNAALDDRYFAARLDELLTFEAEMVNSPDDVIRFHSGPVLGEAV
ncbi:MAG: tRNA-(ms[2]io[6]A)-hydroxylase [Woeseiaceae bacterium]